MARTKTKAHALEVFHRLEVAHPDAHCALDHRGPFQLLVATILSAQCTDERVNMVTPVLFERYRTVRALAGAELPELQEIVRTTGFFRNKAKSLRGAARKLVEEHRGRVPKEMDALLALPGVARKTANVVLGVAFRIPSGVVVDTHVKRISYRLGLTRATDPIKIERDLQRLLPQEAWIDFPHLVIFHGRRVCQARTPRCEECILEEICPKRGLKKPSRSGRATKKAPARKARAR